MQPAGPTREPRLQSAAANADNVVAQHPRRSYTPREMRVHACPGFHTCRPVPACEHERPAHVGAPLTCGKDVQSVGRVAPRENEGRLVQASEAERKSERERTGVRACRCKVHRERSGERGTRETAGSEGYT